ncbi:MAG TPA: class A beta-lactamase-related serine hydrolase [Aggregatilinea sp.]|uniref:serine hydrolase n=1 Tax=Aggregatilinea sp. TaxID=2806333 RepID=UPI002C18DFD6|nr:serine hydrolase [Aggregatilinea sp.]HML22237.1 class A beta-lactamase-related serine hydrolase [Aggregatilinea sp.]
MEYGHLREDRRRLQLPVLEIFSSLLLLAAIVLAMFELVQYSNTQESLQPDVTVAGIPVGGLEEAQAQSRWEAVYMNQPVELVYNGSTIYLDPQAVGFRTNSDAMLGSVRSQSSRQKNFWLGFWNYLWRRPVGAITVPLDAGLEEGDLRDYLTSLAERYDQPAAEGGGFDINTLTFRLSMASSRLDVDAAIPLIESALRSPDTASRKVILPMVQIDAPRQDINSLRDALMTLFQSRGFQYNGADTLASVYILNISTGEEVTIQPDIVYSAVSTIKIPIMVNLFRDKLLVESEPDVAYLLTESILCSNNSASNFLMQVTGTGTNEEAMLREGLNQVSCTAQELGAEHTYISAPLYVGSEGLQFEAAVCRPETPGNQEYNASPDPYAETTAEDMGLMLNEIYDCAEYGSGLKAVYPDDFTQQECKQMIEVMSGNRIDRLMELGIPQGTRIAHKNGWGPDTTGDAGIVYAPNGPYIFVMYTWERDLDGNNLPTIDSWVLIEEASRLTYNYFNPETALYQRRAPINELTAIDCVTVSSSDQVNLNDINANRLDENGNPLPGACYGGAGDCRPFTDWSH